MYSHLILKVPQHPIGNLFGRNTVFVFVRFAYADKIFSWRSKILFKAVLQNLTTPVRIRFFFYFGMNPDPTVTLMGIRIRLINLTRIRIRILVILVRICWNPPAKRPSMATMRIRIGFDFDPDPWLSFCLRILNRLSKMMRIPIRNHNTS